MSDLKQIPDFKNAEEEFNFGKSMIRRTILAGLKRIRWFFSNLKSSTESISLRLPSALLTRIKELANEKDVPYQSLMKVYLSERVKHKLKMTHK